MNREQISKKLKIISSRIDDEFVYGKNKEESVPISNFATISEIYLFGSSLYKEDPRDIDLDIVIHQTEFQRVHHLHWRRKIDPKFEDRHFDKENMFKKVLLEGMYKVHISFPPKIGYEGYYPRHIHHLVWSRGKPDTDKNLEEIWNGEGDIYRNEITQLRNQLRRCSFYERVLFESCQVINDETIRDLARYDFKKAEIPKLREVLRYAEQYHQSESEINLWKKLINFLELKRVGGRIEGYGMR